MDKKNQKIPLKSALKKTKPVETATTASTKRKHAAVSSAPSTSTNGAKRAKPSAASNQKPQAKISSNQKPQAKNSSNQKPQAKNNSNSKNTKTQPKQNNSNNQKKKGVTISAPQKKKGASVTSGSAPAAAVKKVVKPKKIEVVPEGASLEDFRIVAGTYENILYGVDAYWNEVRITDAVK